VNKCVTDSLPLKLWVVVPRRPANPDFNENLRTARAAGVGVIDFPDNGQPNVFHRPVPLSLFALNRVDPRTIQPNYRLAMKNAEDTFRDGDPSQGCQSICQELEDLTRKAAADLHRRGRFQGAWAPANGQDFFETGNWGSLLQAFENRIDVASVTALCPSFDLDMVIRTRGYTNWRNSLSHKPGNLRELRRRDSQLRTMFEATRNLLIDWANATKPLKIK